MSDPTPPEATQVKPFARVLLKETPSCWPVLTVGEADIVFDETRQLFSAQTTVDLINTAAAAYVAQALADATADREGEVKRLQQIVDRLPKTADGVPITFGMEVWYYDEEDRDSRGLPEWWMLGGNVRKTTVTAVYVKHFDEYKGEVTIGVAEDWEGGNADMFSTREAAIESFRHAADALIDALSPKASTP